MVLCPNCENFQQLCGSCRHSNPSESIQVLCGNRRNSAPTENHQLPLCESCRHCSPSDSIQHESSATDISGGDVSNDESVNATYITDNGVSDEELARIYEILDNESSAEHSVLLNDSEANPHSISIRSFGNSRQTIVINGNAILKCECCKDKRDEFGANNGKVLFHNNRDNYDSYQNEHSQLCDACAAEKSEPYLQIAPVKRSLNGNPQLCNACNADKSIKRERSNLVQPTTEVIQALDDPDTNAHMLRGLHLVRRVFDVIRRREDLSNSLQAPDEAMPSAPAQAAKECGQNGEMPVQNSNTVNERRAVQNVYPPGILRARALIAIEYVSERDISIQNRNPVQNISAPRGRSPVRNQSPTRLEMPSAVVHNSSPVCERFAVHNGVPTRARSSAQYRNPARKRTKRKKSPKCECGSPKCECGMRR